MDDAILDLKAVVAKYYGNLDLLDEIDDVEGGRKWYAEKVKVVGMVPPADTRSAKDTSPSEVDRHLIAAGASMDSLRWHTGMSLKAVEVLERRHRRFDLPECQWRAGTRPWYQWPDEFRRGLVNVNEIRWLQSRSLQQQWDGEERYRIVYREECWVGVSFS